MAKYFTLLQLDPDIHKWMIEFGDYQRSVVREELDYWHDSRDVPRKNLRIINTESDDQASINKMVDEINEAELAKHNQTRVGK